MKLGVIAVIAVALYAPMLAQEAPATVFIYRPQAVMKGRWIHPSIYCDGIELTRLYSGTYFRADAPPGKHIVTLGRTEVGQFVDMAPGKNYFFRFGHKNIVVNAVSGREPLTLTQVAEETARKEMSGLKDGSAPPAHKQQGTP